MRIVFSFCCLYRFRDFLLCFELRYSIKFDWFFFAYYAMVGVLAGHNRRCGDVSFGHFSVHRPLDSPHSESVLAARRAPPGPLRSICPSRFRATRLCWFYPGPQGPWRRSSGPSRSPQEIQMKRGGQVNQGSRRHRRLIFHRHHLPTTTDTGWSSTTTRGHGWCNNNLPFFNYFQCHAQCTPTIKTNIGNGWWSAKDWLYWLF